MSTIEKVARAMKLCWQDAKQRAGAPPSYQDLARAALEAMREPSEGMLWAHEMPHIGPDEIRELWKAMIQFALDEGD